MNKFIPIFGKSVYLFWTSTQNNNYKNIKYARTIEDDAVFRDCFVTNNNFGVRAFKKIY